MTEREETREVELVQLPAPKTPIERLVVLCVVLGAALLVALGLGATWAVMAVQGDAAQFPPELRQAFFGSLLFLFGGGIAAKV